MKHLLSALALSLFLLSPAPAEAERRPFEGWHYLGGGASAVVGGAVGATAGIFIGGFILSDGGGLDSLILAMMGGIIGIGPGTAAGLLSYTSATDTEGSTGLAWAGAGLGFAAGFGAFISTIDTNRWVAMGSLLLLPAIGTTLGYGLGQSSHDVSFGIGEVEGTQTFTLIGHF